MSEQNHTPGPWEMPSKPYIAGDTGEGAMFSDGDWEITPPLGHSGPVAVVSGEANARLIAAAPELKDALIELLAAELASYPSEAAGREAQDAWADRRAAARNNASAVIAKATGR